MLKFVRKQLPRRFLRACGAILQLGCLKVARIHQLSGWCLEKTRFWSRVLNGASGELKPLHRGASGRPRQFCHGLIIHAIMFAGRLLCVTRALLLFYHP